MTVLARFARRLLAICLFVLSAPLIAADPPPLEAYGDLPAVEEAAISASGDHIAVISRLEGQRTLLILDSSMALIRKSGVGDVKIRALDWIGDEGVLVTSSETEKLSMDFTADAYEARRAMVVPLDPSRDIEMVFTNTRGIIHSTFGNYGIRQVDGEWRGYFGGIGLERSLDARFVLAGTRLSLFEVDLKRNSAHQIGTKAFDDYWRDWLVSADGEIAARFDMHRSRGEWRIAGLKGKEIAGGTNPKGDASLITLGKDGATAIYSTDDGEITRWYEVPLDGSAQPVEFLPGERADQIYTGKHTGWLLGYLRKGANPRPVFFDPEWDKRAGKVARAFSKLNYDIVDWDDRFEHVLVRTSGTRDSGTLFMVNLTTLQAQPIGYERPAIGASAVGPVSMFAYKAQDGLELDGVLTLPPGRDPHGLPVLIFPHGGPASYDEPEFSWWAQAFASRGYAVFQPNFRGSTNRDDSFERAGYGEWGGKMQSDLSDGLAALAAEGIVDPKRACIMGGSYGGYAALAGVTLQQGLYRCSVSVAGVADLKLLYNTELRESGSSNVWRKALQEQIGRKSDLDEVSPRRFASKADAPVLLIHGRDDTVVAYEQSTKMADALKDAGKPFEFIELKGEDHWLSRAETRKQMLEAAVAFVQKYNPAD